MNFMNEMHNFQDFNRIFIYKYFFKKFKKKIITILHVFFYIPDSNMINYKILSL